jgi:hypothetical protein
MEPAQNSSAPSERERALVALTLAGRALDPNAGPAFRDRRVAAELLARALRSGLIALGGAPDAPLDEALAALDPAVLRGAGYEREAAAAFAARLDAIGAGREPGGDLRDEELFVARIVERARGEKQLARVARLRRWIGAGLAVVAAVAVLAVQLLADRRGASLHFVASSATSGFSKSGKVGDLGASDLFFHTANEDNPWVEIDLGQERDIAHVKVTNRVDCCADRAIPLVVSVRPESGPLREVARQTANFDEWTASFTTQRARYVRLSVAKKTHFHLQAVSIP